MKIDTNYIRYICDCIDQKEKSFDPIPLEAYCEELAEHVSQQDFVNACNDIKPIDLKEFTNNLDFGNSTPGKG